MRRKARFRDRQQTKGWKTISWQSGHVIYHCIHETIKFDFRVRPLRRVKYLLRDCSTKNYNTDLFLLLKKCNLLSSKKYLDTLKNTFVERSTQYTSFSSREQPANAGSERKQFTENASVALQQTILTHAHTKCPPVGVDRPSSW